VLMGVDAEGLHGGLGGRRRMKHLRIA
jgi:hypothetical protein